MYSKIKTRVEYENLTFEHLGELNHFQELPIDEATKEWTGALEAYQLKTKGDKTVLTVRVDVAEMYIDFMKSTFPKALAKLKELSEK